MAVLLLMRSKPRNENIQFITDAWVNPCGEIEPKRDILNREAGDTAIASTDELSQLGSRDLELNSVCTFKLMVPREAHCGIDSPRRPSFRNESGSILIHLNPKPSHWTIGICN